MSLICRIEQCRFIKIGGGGFEFAATVIGIGAGENIRRFFRIQFDCLRIRLDRIFKISGAERFAPHTEIDSWRSSGRARWRDEILRWRSDDRFFRWQLNRAENAFPPDAGFISAASANLIAASSIRSRLKSATPRLYKIS